MPYGFSESNVGPGLSPCLRPSGRRFEPETNTIRASFVVDDAERKLGGALETPIQGDAPVRRVALGPKNATDRRISIGFTTVRGPEAHRDSAEALAPRQLPGIRLAAAAQNTILPRIRRTAVVFASAIPLHAATPSLLPPRLRRKQRGPPHGSPARRPKPSPQLRTRPLRPDG